MSEDHNKLNVTRWLSDLQSPHPTPPRPKRKHKSSTEEPGRRSKRHCLSQTSGRIVFAQVNSNVMPAPATQKGVTLEKIPPRKSSRTPSPTKKHLDIVSLTPVPVADWALIVQDVHSTSEDPEEQRCLEADQASTYSSPPSP